MKIRRLTVPAAALAVASMLAACGGGDDPLSSETSADSGSGSDTGAVIIGSADFSESQLIATIYSQALQEAGVEVTEKLGIGSREVYMQALEDGSIDLIPEYGGTLLKFLDPEATASSRDDVLAALADALPDGLEALDASEAEDKDSVTVTKAFADENGLTTISDLAPIASTMSLGGPAEWKTRATGVPGLESVYGLTFKEFVTLDAGGPLTLAALQNGQIQAGNMFTSDPAIAANDLVSLEDDKGLFPADPVLPVINSAKNTDTITEVLNKVSAALTTDDLLELNGKASAGDQLSEIAKDWLSENGI